MVEREGTEQSRTKEWLKNYGGWVGIVVLMIGFVFAVFLIPDSSSNPETTEACPASVTPSAHMRLREGTVPVPMIPEQPEGVVINFWRNRFAQEKLFYLDAGKRTLRGNERLASLPTGAYLDLSKKPLDREGLDGSIAPEEYTAIAQVTAHKEVTLTVCANPGARNLDAGTYVGGVRLSSPLIEDVTVPVTVTLQYRGYRLIAAAIGVIAFIAGSFFVWASGRKSSNLLIWQWNKGLKDLPRWLLYNYVGVVAGIIAGISVFLASYWHNPAWGANAPEDWFALLGATFTAYTATLTAATAVVHERPPEKAAQQVPPATP
jgi:hypothetical protein